MIDRHKLAFVEEATELLGQLESSLLLLEKNIEEPELIARVFRALHTIKGSGGMFGFDEISMFTHDIESVYDLIRSNKISATTEIINLTLSAKDQIYAMLVQTEENRLVDENETAKIIKRFKEIITQSRNKSEKSSIIELDDSPKEKSKVFKGALAKYKIDFKPFPELFQSGNNPILLMTELREMGDCKIVANIKNLEKFEDFNPELCYTEWEIYLNTTRDIDAIKDVFIFVEGSCDLKIQKQEHNKSEVFEHDNAQNLQLDDEELRRDDLLKEKASKKKMLMDSHIESEGSSIRVSANKLDELVNLVGELVIVQARLSQTAVKMNETNLSSIAEEVERLTWDLRDSALNIRMLTIGTTFSKFNRLVRDLSLELGKEVELTTEGADTELDKTVIERLNDPLIHIIRNSVDHGIELPEVRERMGKPKLGIIHLSASQSGGSVLIRIADDGAGLSKERIRAKAIENGLIQADTLLTDSELYNLIMLPGFSTAKKITNVSGRGVGMDVVRLAIENLRGSIEIESEEGKGSIITLKLPLTLAIIDGLLVTIRDDYFVLPLSVVQECIELNNQDDTMNQNRHLVNIRGEIVPYIRLREHFKSGGEKPAIEQVVIVGVKGNRVGLVVDNVVGQHQTVLKNLGKMYKNIEDISGATILGDGTVALIIDVAKLVYHAETEEKSELLNN